MSRGSKAESSHASAEIQQLARGESSSKARKTTRMQRHLLSVD